MSNADSAWRDFGGELGDGVGRAFPGEATSRLEVQDVASVGGNTLNRSFTEAGANASADAAAARAGGEPIVVASHAASRSSTDAAVLGGAQVGNNADAGSGEVTITASAPGTLQQLADYLKQGYWAFNGSNFNWKWGTSNITFNVQSLTAQEQTWAREAFKMASRVANLTFTEVTSGGNIVFSSPDSGQPNYGSAFANFSGFSGTITSATVSISADWASWNASSPYYNYYFQTYVHEIGHALGLGHQGPYNGAAIYPTNALYDNDSWQLSVMSYFDQVENTYSGLLGSFAYVSSYMQADILALQDKYGTPVNPGTHWFGYLPTVTGNGFNSGANFGARSFTMYSADGYVFLDSSDYTGAQTSRMGSGQFSSIYGYTDNVSQYNSVMTTYVGGSGIDDVTLATTAPAGSGGIVVYGNGGNDIFRSLGGVGHTIDGGIGSDTIIYNFASSGASIVHLANGSWRITAGGFVDTLTGVEIARFSNGDVSLPFYVSTSAPNDFNGDGTSDILWRNSTTGDVGAFGIIGGVASWHGVSTTGLSWNVYGTGDFNGDGTTDILIGTVSNGVTYVGSWQMGNFVVGSYAGIGATPSAWSLVGTGNFNGDSTDDILWRNSSTGDVGIFEMDNGVATWRGVGTTGQSWNVYGTGDFNGNGTTDVLIGTVSNGVTYIGYWQMNDAAV